MTERMTVEEFRKGKNKPTYRQLKDKVERLEALLKLIEKLSKRDTNFAEPADQGMHVSLEWKFHKTRKWRLDLVIPSQFLALEIDGGGWVRGAHHRPEGRRRDNEKANAAQGKGWKVLRLDWEQVISGVAYSLIRTSMERSWWSGPTAEEY